MTAYDNYLAGNLEDVALGDVVAAQVGMRQVQQPMAETPAGLDQPLPRRGVHGAGNRESSRALERLDESDRAVTEGLLRVVGREVSEGGESLM